MTLSARVRANRANARRCRGPRTAAGKAKAAKNAFRHGLEIPLSAVAEYADDVRQCARLLAGPKPSLERRERARQAAECQLDLVRIRRARIRLLGDAYARVKEPSMRDLDHAINELGASLLRPDGAVDERAEGVLRALQGVGPGSEPLTLAEGIAVLIPALTRLDRYERRALSRRRKAIAALTEAR